MEMVDRVQLENLGVASRVEKKPNQLGQDEFLQLMVAQIRHQDPFEPMENGEFIAQLAQFGTVSGIQELQTAFGGLSESLVSNQSLQASNIIGRNVRIASDSFVLTQDGTLDAVVNLPAGSQSTVIRISDDAGNLVSQVGLGPTPAGQTEFSWDGTLSNGNQAPAGRYHLAAESIIAGQAVVNETFIEVGIDSVTIGNGRERQLVLNLESGEQINFSEISQIL